ncbi:hypothetical protein HELRODRAFT_164241 [Helobdella robusta]|uniref:Uncharacterized protein n=1 Tax=Helobdella robusta TaxID=6412 RepID=T1EV55_HELRO|nr:hypothetical protein HELRODRAFT_164241 [Helobdella robusta]ESN94406.1 hypothetical protein HELRODRAFT_164241 [Helobdella robusta]
MKKPSKDTVNYQEEIDLNEGHWKNKMKNKINGFPDYHNSVFEACDSLGVDDDEFHNVAIIENMLNCDYSVRGAVVKFVDEHAEDVLLCSLKHSWISSNLFLQNPFCLFSSFFLKTFSAIPKSFLTAELLLKCYDSIFAKKLKQESFLKIFFKMLMKYYDFSTILFQRQEYILSNGKNLNIYIAYQLDLRNKWLKLFTCSNSSKICWFSKRPSLLVKYLTSCNSNDVQTMMKMSIDIGNGNQNFIKSKDLVVLSEDKLSPKIHAVHQQDLIYYITHERLRVASKSVGRKFKKFVSPVNV